MYQSQFCSGLYLTCLFVFTVSGGERQPRSAPSAVLCSTCQCCFLKFPLSLITSRACTQAALINQMQMAILKVAAVTAVGCLQSALLPTCWARHRGAVSMQQALCSPLDVRGGNPALFHPHRAGCSWDTAC